MPIATASVYHPSLRRTQAAPAAVSSSEREIENDPRRYARFELNLLGRFMRADKQEFPCRISNISVGDAMFLAPVAVEPGERIIAYLDEIGGIEGTVTRAEQGGFALQLSVSQHKRQKLASQITWIINRSELEGVDSRRPGHERLASGEKKTILRNSFDQEFEVSLQDVSISGASVMMTERPTLGSEIALGKLRALVVRHHPEGIGVQFLDIQNPDALRRYFG